MPVSAFIDTLGVNTHINYTDGAYANLRNVADDLTWLGIHHVRDETPGGTVPLSSYAFLAQRGARFNLFLHSPIPTAVELSAQLNTAVPGSVAAIEGLNEVDNFPVPYKGLTGTAAGLAVQREIYRRVHSEPQLAGVAVYDLTGFDPKPVDTRANAADYTNMHIYPQNGEQPSYNANGDKFMPPAIELFKKFQRPNVITEFGYFSLPQSGWLMIGVDEQTQAKGILNGYMDAAAAGVARTYAYELLDQKPDTQGKENEMHYGFFRNDNSPKPVAHAVRNLTTILNASALPRAGADKRGAPPPAYTLSGLPVSGNSLLLQKEDGRFVLVLWDETQIWNRATGTPITNPAADVELDIGANASSVVIYDPLVSATPLASHRNVRRLKVAVPDHPLMLELTFSGTQGT
nr:calcium-binding protein [Burkholderia sp. Ax-1719]